MSVLLVSPAGTGGWRANEEALSAGLRSLGVDHKVRRVSLGRLERLRHPWATGAWLVAAASRRALLGALGQSRPSAVIAVNSTAAMLFPFGRLRDLGIPVAIRIDCPAGEQFPGPAHALHRRLERRALAEADLALTMGPRSSESVEPLARRVAEVPLGVEPAPAAEPPSPPVLLAYAGQPQFKGLDLIAAAWAELGDRRGEATLTITGIEAAGAEKFLGRHGGGVPAGVRLAGTLRRSSYEKLLREATAFVSASRIEGYGLAQLEALAAGVPLVTTPSRGAYEAEPLARALAPELCSEPRDLASAIAAALAMAPEVRREYGERAAELLRPYSGERAREGLRDALITLGAPAQADA